MSDFNAESYTTQVNRQVSNTVSADYTLQKEDEGSIVIVDSSSSIVEITIPSDASVNIPVGTVIWLYRDGANFVRLVEDTGVTLNPNEGFIQSDKTEIYIRKQAANEWVIGDLGGYQTFITATGGTVSDITVGGVDYRVHEFTTVGTSTFNVTGGEGEVDVLIVGGGGGGAGIIGGGGGGGGIVFRENQTVNFNTSYSISVGSGGIGGRGWNTSDQYGRKGVDSSALNFTAIGGGGGGAYGGNTPSSSQQLDGGSGGGEGRLGIGVALQPSSSSGGFGNNGGSGSIDDNAGGGGGASENGQNSSRGSYSGDGGTGLYYGDIFGNVFGENGYFSGGGGGGARSGRGVPGVGGSGGGGNGTGSTSYVTDSPSNTGGGGGGAGYSGDSGGRLGGAGGSGIVIIRYPI